MSNESFFVAPFAQDGELVGVGTERLAYMSPRWLALCEKMLNDCGQVFRVSLAPPLNHLEVKLTSANGAGLGMFFTHGNIAVSTA